MREVRGRFLQVDHDHAGRPRLYFDNAGGSFRLKAAVERFAQIDAVPDNTERIHPVARELQAIQATGTDDLRMMLNAEGRQRACRAHRIGRHVRDGACHRAERAGHQHGHHGAGAPLVLRRHGALCARDRPRTARGAQQSGHGRGGRGRHRAAGGRRHDAAERDLRLQHLGRQAGPGAHRGRGPRREARPLHRGGCRAARPPRPDRPAEDAGGRHQSRALQVLRLPGIGPGLAVGPRGRAAAPQALGQAGGLLGPGQFLALAVRRGDRDRRLRLLAGLPGP